MIVIMNATVYYAATKGRRYFSKSAAIHAETMAIIMKKYPSVHMDEEGYSFYVKEMEGFDKIYRRIRRLVKKSI